MLLKRAGNLTLIPACEKSSKYGENEQVFSDTRKSGCCHNIGLRNCMLGGTHYCCDRQWKREWVGGWLSDFPGKDSSSVQWYGGRCSSRNSWFLNVLFSLFSAAID